MRATTSQKDSPRAGSRRRDWLLALAAVTAVSASLWTWSGGPTAPRSRASESASLAEVAGVSAAEQRQHAANAVPRLPAVTDGKDPPDAGRGSNAVRVLAGHCVESSGRPFLGRASMGVWNVPGSGKFFHTRVDVVDGAFRVLIPVEELAGGFCRISISESDRHRVSAVVPIAEGVEVRFDEVEQERIAGHIHWIGGAPERWGLDLCLAGRRDYVGFHVGAPLTGLQADPMMEFLGSTDQYRSEPIVLFFYDADLLRYVQRRDYPDLAAFAADFARGIEVDGVPVLLRFTPTANGAVPTFVDVIPLIREYYNRRTLAVDHDEVRLHLGEGRYRIVGRFEDDEPLRVVDIQIEPGSKFVPVHWQHELVPGQSFDVEVVDQDDRPISDAAVALQGSAGALRGVIEVEAAPIQGQPGRYRATGLPGGRYLAVVSRLAAGVRSSAELECEVPSEPLRIVLVTTAWLDLNLQLAPGLGLVTLRDLQAHRRNVSDGIAMDWEAVPKNPANGDFLGGAEIQLPEGVHEIAVTASASGLRLVGASRLVVNRGAERVAAELVLSPAVEILGRVVDEDGAVVANATLYAGVGRSDSRASAYPLEIARSRADGSFRLVVREDCRFVNVSRPGSSSAVVAPIGFDTRPLIITVR